MADVKISALPTGVALTGAELVPVVQSATTIQTTVTAYKTLIAPLTTKGDILGYSTVNARVPVGTNDQVLMADSAQALGIKYSLVGTNNLATGAVTDTKASLATKPAVTVVATTNQALTGTPTIDGQATASGSIILLTAQSTGAENGPWVAAAGAWARPTWYPSGGTTQAFQFITCLVRLGTTYQGTTWRMTTSGAITIDTTATTWVVTPLAINSSTITGTVPAANLPTNTQIMAIGGTFFPSGAGIVGDISVPYACTINSVTMLADTTGSIVIDIWKDTYANYPPTVADSITAAALPTISSAAKSTDATLTGWTTSIAAGDTLRFNVNSVSTISRVALILKVTKT